MLGNWGRLCPFDVICNANDPVLRAEHDPLLRTSHFPSKTRVPRVRKKGAPPLNYKLGRYRYIGGWVGRATGGGENRAMWLVGGTPLAGGLVFWHSGLALRTIRWVGGWVGGWQDTTGCMYSRLSLCCSFPPHGVCQALPARCAAERAMCPRGASRFRASPGGRQGGREERGGTGWDGRGAGGKEVWCSARDCNSPGSILQAGW